MSKYRSVLFIALWPAPRTGLGAKLHICWKKVFCFWPQFSFIPPRSLTHEAYWTLTPVSLHGQGSWGAVFRDLFCLVNSGA